jgi:hypothetical protein
MDSFLVEKLFQKSYQTPDQVERRLQKEAEPGCNILFQEWLDKLGDRFHNGENSVTIRQSRGESLFQNRLFTCAIERMNLQKGVSVTVGPFDGGHLDPDICIPPSRNITINYKS